MIRLTGWFLSFALAASAFAQLSLSTNNCQTPVSGAEFNFGTVNAGFAEDVTFCIQYTGTSPTYYLNYFNVTGTGFTVTQTDWNNQLPALIPAAGLNFTVGFQPGGLGNYSATFGAYGTEGVDNISLFFIGQGLPLSLSLSGQPLASGQTVSFPGEVQVGSTGTVQLTLSNQSNQSLTVATVAVQGSGFSLAGNYSGTTVPADSSTELGVTFTPTASGAQSGTLTIGGFTFPLQGVGAAPPPAVFPTPSIQVNLPTQASAQQGQVSVSLAQAAPSSGSGTVTLAFQSAVSGVTDDPTIAFSDGTRSAAFTVAQGTTTGQFTGGSSVSFQTGTTAGTITFTVALGNQSATSNVTIGVADVAIDAAVAARNVACAVGELYCTTANVQLQINGWDNTYSTSQVVFNFYDAHGNSISPGAITVNAASAFQSYFSSSALGGVFGLSALFPVAGGNPDDVSAAVVQFTNSAGTTKTATINF
jgi:Abnormal spindle-like microcephaly-assoc'd, ASPM-SPD-2-Hydin